ncbi:MFS transporter [Actinomadura sp. WMMB 499]|uniref:MFS transporter n=1 Tax=Actinomadura sp. WMMB 499 TaxID=1219491 RepID=UPI001244A65F|nr:MFS transporter [Actinomadura sp. WMMB 499]QFG24562.1 MFS transporter [Actinomadura sp. WMMB 499]
MGLGRGATGDEEWQVAVAAAVFGAGLGLALPAPAGLIVGGVPADQTGAASGMNANVRTIGGAIGTALVGSIVVSPATVRGYPPESGCTSGFLLLAGLSAAAAVAALLVPRGTAAAGTVADGPRRRTRWMCGAVGRG